MTHIEFKGKSTIANHHLSVPFHNLQADPRKSLLKRGQTPSLNDNIILHGDNLLALKALLPTHAGKINCIYIDPPYNTGNEKWVYNDNVNNPMFKDWLGKTVDSEDLTRHDKWLCMMYPRLSLLRELLTDDGVIFVSIDDNEQHRLRMLMDEIFGINCFIVDVVWEKVRIRKNSAKYFSSAHDTILIYSKSADSWIRQLLPRDNTENFQNLDNDPRGPYIKIPIHANHKYEADYTITTPSGKILHPPRNCYWRLSKANFQKHVDENRLYWSKNDGYPAIKRFLTDVQDGLVPKSIFFYDEVGGNPHGDAALKQLFNGEKVFENPKPPKLIETLIRIATSSSKAIVLDSFAGAGTTAHAVLAMNKEDGGNRKFILVECEDYADKITAERVRRVIKGVKTAKDENLRNGYGGGFSYWKLGDALELKSMLNGDDLPTYEELARYVFYTATAEQWKPQKMNQKTHYIGESDQYQVYLIYTPDINTLKQTALTLEIVQNLPPAKNNKWRLIYAPTAYIDSSDLATHKIKFAQIPFEIYQTLTK